MLTCRVKAGCLFLQMWVSRMEAPPCWNVLSFSPGRVCCFLFRCANLGNKEAWHGADAATLRVTFSLQSHWFLGVKVPAVLKGLEEFGHLWSHCVCNRTCWLRIMLLCHLLANSHCICLCPFCPVCHRYLSQDARPVRSAWKPVWLEVALCEYRGESERTAQVQGHCTEPAGDAAGCRDVKCYTCTGCMQ